MKLSHFWLRSHPVDNEKKSYIHIDLLAEIENVTVNAPYMFMEKMIDKII